MHSKHLADKTVVDWPPKVFQGLVKLPYNLIKIQSKRLKSVQQRKPISKVSALFRVGGKTRLTFLTSSQKLSTNPHHFLLFIFLIRQVF